MKWLWRQPDACRRPGREAAAVRGGPFYRAVEPTGSTAGRRSHRPPLTSLHITLGNEKSSPPLSGDTNLSGALHSISFNPPRPREILSKLEENANHLQIQSV